MTDHYMGNPNVKGDGVTQPWTEHDVREYAKCMQDPAYFARTYVKIISLDKGLVNFNLYDYQEQMFKHFENERFSIVLACRQSGKSISSVVYLLWYAIFHPEKTIAVLANKGATAREMLSRVTLALENLPFFLQPGCRALNKGSIEFAFVERAAEFYTSTYPVVSAGKDTKVIITSTANGIGNQFHKIWEGAVQKINEYKPFTVNWWDVPGRDEEWKSQTISNTSQLQFDQEFGNTFFGTGDTLIGAETLLNFRATPPKRIIENGSVKVYADCEPKHDYIICVDVAKGRGLDYSTFSVIDVTVRPFKQVAVYRNNRISPILFPDIIYKIANAYNQAYVIIESNDAGQVVCNGLYHDLEYENIHLESAVKRNAIGIEMNRKVKRLGCSGIKDLLEEKKLEIVDEDTIMEISTFVSKGQSYEASDGNHDDLMMNLVMFGFFITTQYFSDMTDINLKQMMFEQQMAEIEADMVPFGFIDDGEDAINHIEMQDELKDKGWHIPWEVENY